MWLVHEIRDGVGVLRPQGRFVTGSDAELAAAREFLDNNQITQAVIDFSAVPYIDSTGLAFVVDLHNLLVKRGGRLTLVNVNTRVREVLALTRIDRIIPTYADATQADNASRMAVAC